MYEPKPIDTSGVMIGELIEKLTETLAQNSHDHWAAKRIASGWTWGNKRNDDAKLHPCLVPYVDLPESEKEYDRASAMETIKVLVKLGYL